MTNQPLTPLIFIHKGWSSYLDSVFAFAKFTQGHREIILLGDEDNKHLAEANGLTHHMLADYSSSVLLNQFDKVYRHIAGASHGKSQWVKFVFERWFILCEFITRHEIDSFWTFDSDTLITHDLSTFEAYFKSIDNTEQCGGSCMNGYIANRATVENYVKAMIQMYQDEAFLDKQHQEFLLHPDWALTEMRAYDYYKSQHHPQTVHLTKLFTSPENTLFTFDDALCMADGYVTDTCENKVVKKLHVDSVGKLICITSQGQQIQLVTANLSWLPDYVFFNIIEALKNPTSKGIKQVAYSPGIMYKIRWRLRSLLAPPMKNTIKD